MKKFIIISFFTFATLLSLSAVHVEAAESITGLIPCTANRGGTDPSKEPSGLNCNTWQEFVEVIQFLINFSFILASILATISITYAGWLYLTSNGDMGKVKQAHGIFIKVVQGFLVLGFAYLLIKTVLTGLVADSDYNLLQ